MTRYVSTTEGIGVLDDGEVELLVTDYRDLGEALTDGVDLAELSDAPAPAAGPEAVKDLGGRLGLHEASGRGRSRRQP